MAAIDFSSEHGQRALARLQSETVVWLTTAGKSGAPAPRPVWFLWEHDAVLIYSQPGTAKLRHLAGNSRVALNFNSTDDGGDVVVFSGAATVEENAPPASAVPAYVAKYAGDIAGLSMNPESFAASYSVAIRVSLEKLWGF